VVVGGKDGEEEHDENFKSSWCAECVEWGNMVVKEVECVFVEI